MSGGGPGRDRPPDAPPPDTRKMAAIMAAVQAYLNAETSDQVPGARGPQRSWRMALWPQLYGPQLRRGATWKGRS